MANGIARREFIAALGGAAAAWPLAVRAQQPALPVVGFINGASPAPRNFAAFRQGLKEAGYVEGQNVAIEARWAQGRYDRLPAMVDELIGRHVAVIATTGGLDPARAAKAATTSVPIVFVVGGDPVKFGLVDSLGHPGGNLTGVSLPAYLVEAKRLELVRELLPKSAVVAVLVNPTNSETDSGLIDLQAAARTLGERLIILNARTESDIDMAFATLRQQRVDALIVSPDPFLLSQHGQIVGRAMRLALPAVYAWRDYTDAGGLMSYGTSIPDAYRAAAVYAGRLLKGEKPADLAVQQSVKVELIVNLKTAKALGIEVPPALLIRADEVIE
jgi:putative tryptophan/tyrosine transport system substrate-binding protein